MSLTLHIDTEAWRQHLRTTAASVEGLVPVAKGNGYGYGIPRLVAEAQVLGASVLAVGTLPEVRAARDAGWQGDLVVLTPWTSLDGPEALDDDHLIVTIGRLDDLTALLAARPDARFLLEVLTSMLRHGMPTTDAGRAASILAESPQARFEGWTIHLPMAGDDRPGEARRLADAVGAHVPGPLWLSHLGLDEYRRFAQEQQQRNGQATHLRLGTQLWLGAPASRRVTARVLDLHPVRRGQRAGYWQRRMPGEGWVVVVSGGTAHGIAMEAPTAASTPRQRAIALVTGSLEAAGLALSPYTVGGRKRFFVEPPHMQSSLVFLPGAAAVAVGDDIGVEARMTTVTFDAVEG